MDWGHKALIGFVIVLIVLVFWDNIKTIIFKSDEEIERHKKIKSGDK